MGIKNLSIVFFLLGLFCTKASLASVFGEELIPLTKLVAGQIVEIEKLAEVVGAAKQQRDLLLTLNDGINQVTHQIQAIESIVERAKDLDPKAIRSLSDLNHFLDEVKSLKKDTEEVIAFKLLLCDQAISETALQSDTAYKMGQEMIGVGGSLGAESQTASPGRAAQITAASSSAQMLAHGVELQTLAHIAELQALSLELQKSHFATQAENESVRQNYFAKELEHQKNREQTRSLP